METRSSAASVSAPTLSPSLGVSDCAPDGQESQISRGGKGLEVSLLTAGQGCSPIKELDGIAGPPSVE